MAALGAPLLGMLPQDPAISRYDAEGRPLVGLDDTSAIYPAVKAILDKCLHVPDRA
jgi:CO dehydrogenase nickel-insertion accessory protein CooC1